MKEKAIDKNKIMVYIYYGTKKEKKGTERW